MIKVFFKKTILISSTILFVGCTSSSLNITYDANSKTTMIDLGSEKVYKVENSEKVVKRQGSKSIGKSYGGVSNYNSSGVCSFFSFYELPELGRNQYYNTFAKADVYKRYKYLNCTTETVNNLEFHQCGATYVITYEQLSPDEGFLISKKYLTTNNELCFNEIKELAKKEK